MALVSRQCVLRPSFSFVQFFVCFTALGGSHGFNVLPFELNDDKKSKNFNDSTIMLSNDSTTLSAIQERLHPGIIASVIIVSLMAIMAGIFIIRKYCFQSSEATYRYSLLRGMEAQVVSADLEDENQDEDLEKEESDEDLLE